LVRIAAVFGGEAVFALCMPPPITSFLSSPCYTSAISFQDQL
jgi:hypothetical protein